MDLSTGTVAVGNCPWKIINEFWHINPIPGQCAHISTALTQSHLRTSLSLLPQSQSKSSSQHFCSAGTETAPEWCSMFQLTRGRHQPLAKTLVFSCGNSQPDEEKNRTTREHLWERVIPRAARGVQQGLPLAEPTANCSPFSSALSS